MPKTFQIAGSNCVGIISSAAVKYGKDVNFSPMAISPQPL